MEPVIRILIVGHNKLICNVLTAVLEDEVDISVVGGVTSVNEALKLAPEADVILVNIQMADGGALKLIHAISATGIPSKALVLGLEESKNQILQFIQAGAAGYVLNKESVQDLLARIRDIYAGQVKVSPQIASALMSRLSEYARMLQRVKTNLTEIDELTTREMEILELIGQGFTNQEIANRLVIELGTVKNHVHNILQKMNANTRQEAAANWVIVRTETDFRSRILE
ncbi:MAG: response regulator transcription factor [Anaerolineales bacterium]|jgi:DNA-binding NarL/FixJ family response regulator